MGEEEKLLRAVEKDQASIDREIAGLMSLKRPLKIILKEGSAETVIMARRLKGSELLALRRGLGAISDQLVQGLENVSLTPEQSEKLIDVMDKYIQAATGIPSERMKAEVDDERIRQKLFIEIVAKSSLKPVEVESLLKFRGDT
jgi:hypothetical protein